jgi:hypothetical protein
MADIWRHVTTKHRVISILVRVVEYALGGLFLYLGATKFLGDTHTLGRILMAAAELTVGVLIFVRVSEMVATPAVIVVAATEVALFSRPPLVAIACVSAHMLIVRLRGTKLERLHETSLHDH